MRCFTLSCALFKDFERQRPFTINRAVRTPAGYHGDLQITSLDGAYLVFNGALEVLMAKGTSSDPGVGFAMTALLQVSCDRSVTNATGAMAQVVLKMFHREIGI